MPSSEIPAKTPPPSDVKPPPRDPRERVRLGPVVEDPLVAQGQAFWQAQRFDSAARAVFKQLATGPPKPDQAPWHTALKVADDQAESTRLINGARHDPSHAKEILEPRRESARKLCLLYPASSDLHMTCGLMALACGDEKVAMKHLQIAQQLGLADWVSFTNTVMGFWDAAPRPLGVDFGLWWLDRCDAEQDWECYEKSVRLIMRDTTRSLDEMLRLRKGLAVRANEVTTPLPVRRVITIERARLAVWAGVATEALTLLEELEPGDVNDPEICAALARTLIAHDDLRRAFDYLSHIALDKTTKVLLNEIAQRLEEQGDLDAAVHVLRHINNNDELVQSIVPPSDKETEAKTALAMAEWQVKQGRISSALGQFFRALNLGITDDTAVLDQIEKHLEHEHHPEPYWQRLADYHIQKGNLYQSFKNLRRLQGHLTYGPRARATMRDVLDRLLEETPGAAQLHLELGMLLMVEQDFDQAVEELKRASLEPEVELLAQCQLALCHYHTGQFALALDLFHRIPLDDEMIEALTAMSHQLEQSGLNREALEAARIIHTHDPGVPGIEDRIIYLTQRVNSAGIKPRTGDDRIREILGEQAAHRYRFGAKIGTGGMGLVYRVLDTELNVQVALKVLRESLSSSQKAVERFFREARIAASLHHPNIVNIFDYSVQGAEGPSYITMEYVDGPSIREIIESKFSTTFDITVDDVLDSLNYTVQLCDALNATHRQGIIHRDIKPDNIMINSSGVVKVTDFGIVHVEEATFTPTGALIGTPRYMSPEQVQGKRVDGRSDLYAVGIILYELLVGTPPFVSGDIAYQQVNIVPPRPREICPIIPEDVDGLIMKCLKKDPAERPADARTLRRELTSLYHRYLPQGLTPRNMMSEDPGLAN